MAFVDKSSEKDLSCIKIQHHKFAKERPKAPDVFSKQVLWTVEVKIELFGCSEQRNIWIKKGVEFHEKSTSPPVKHKERLIMLWVCVAASGTGNVSLARGRMSLIIYQQILKANTPSVKMHKMKKGWLLQQDNEPKHQNSTMDYLSRCKMKVLPWPSQSLVFTSSKICGKISKERCMQESHRPRNQGRMDKTPPNRKRKTPKATKHIYKLAKEVLLSTAYVVCPNFCFGLRW